MSLPLKEIRLGISDTTHAALEARAIADDRDMNAVIRDLLDDFARREHRAYTVYARRIIANGSQMELPGCELEEAGKHRSVPDNVGLRRNGARR